MLTANGFIVRIYGSGRLCYEDGGETFARGYSRNSGEAMILEELSFTNESTAVTRLLQPLVTARRQVPDLQDKLF
jgi:hypothetical protein